MQSCHRQAVVFLAAYGCSTANLIASLCVSVIDMLWSPSDSETSDMCPAVFHAPVVI